MQTIIDKVYNHPVHAGITNTLEALGQVKERRTYEDLYTDEVMQRAEYVLKYIQNKLQSADPLLVVTTTLDNINQHFPQIIGNVNNYYSSGNVAYLQGIDATIIAILQQQFIIIPPQNLEDISALKDAISGLKRSFGQQVSHANKQVESLSAKADDSLTALTEQISEINTRIAEKVSEFEEHIASMRENYDKYREEMVSNLKSTHQELKDELRDIDGETKEKVGEWEEELLSLKEQFEDLMQAQKEAFAATLETSTTKMNDQTHSKLMEFQAAARDIIETEQKRLEELWEFLQIKKSEVEELAGSVSISSMAGFYKGIADREKKSENLWKIITIIVFVLLIGFTGYNAFHTTDNFTWTQLAPKLPVSIAFASFLAFCLRQLTVHRKHERYNRQTQLELSALEPYITTLGPEVSKEIKSKLAEKLFGRADQMIGVSTSDDKPEIVSQEVMLQLLDKVGTIVKGK